MGKNAGIAILAVAGIAAVSLLAMQKKVSQPPGGTQPLPPTPKPVPEPPEPVPEPAPGPAPEPKEGGIEFEGTFELWTPHADAGFGVAAIHGGNFAMNELRITFNGKAQSYLTQDMEARVRVYAVVDGVKVRESPEAVYTLRPGLLTTIEGVRAWLYSGDRPGNWSALAEIRDDAGKLFGTVTTGVVGTLDPY